MGLAATLYQVYQSWANLEHPSTDNCSIEEEYFKQAAHQMESHSVLQAQQNQVNSGCPSMDNCSIKECSVQMAADNFPLEGSENMGLCSLNQDSNKADFVEAFIDTDSLDSMEDKANINFEEGNQAEESFGG